MADLLQTVSVISFLATGIFAVVTVAIWIVFKIPSVASDLSGRTAKKSIERMRRDNEKTGEKAYRVSPENRERGKLTGTIETAVKALQRNEETGLLNENLAGAREEKETGILIDDSTESLGDSGVTVPLDPKRICRAPSKINIQIISEIMLVHTEEGI